MNFFLKLFDLFKKDLRGDGNETYRRLNKRAQRDHRKTHVIRSEDTLAAQAELPEFSSNLLLSNITNSTAVAETETSQFVSPNKKSKPKRTSSKTNVQYLSPVPTTPETPVVETPSEDKSKDPDWMPPNDEGPDWAKTPLGHLMGGKRRFINKNVSLLKVKD